MGGLSCRRYLTHNWIVHYLNIKMLQQVTRFLQGDLLDIGCGQKLYDFVINPYVKRYIGIEHPATPYKNPAIDIYADGAALPFRDKSFDTVMALMVLEHAREPHKILAEIFRVLKYDGHLIITVPLMWGIHGEPDDFYRYTSYGLRYILEKERFEVVLLSAYCGFWIMIGMRFSYYLNTFRFPLSTFLFMPVKFLAQAVSIILDSIHRVETDTIAYIAVARKKII